MSVGFMLIGLSLNSGCTVLPKAPEMRMGLYDNYSKSKDGKVDRSKSPVFQMIGADGVEFEIPWNSKSAKNMVCSPYKDYEEFNAYLKKIFYILQSEMLKRGN